MYLFLLFILKNIVLSFPFLLFAFLSKAQRNYSAFDILKESLIVPPNGIWLNGNTFLDDSEVMNSNYLEYLHFLAQDSSEQALIKAYPDTNIFGNRHLNQLLKEGKQYYKKKGNKHVPISILRHDELVHEPQHKHHWWNYFSYHGTKHFPVVGITYEQAQAYCVWRSAFVTDLFNNVLEKKKKYKKFDHQFVQFEFSLPDEKTWELAADGNTYDSTLALHIIKTNTVANNQPSGAFDNTPNSKGFYNLIGNVAEMTAQKGIAKGGSFVNTFKECAPTNAISYAKPERWLGFRCMCKVTAKPVSK